MYSTLKTGILLATLTALLVGVGYLIGGTSGVYIFLGISILINIGSYWFSDKIALASSGAKPLTREQAPQIFADVEELATKMNIPTPSIHLIPSPQPNAFATGRNPKNGAIALTQGIVSSLTRDELRGVIAHELGHIASRDVLLSTMAAVIAGSISALANIALWGGDDRDRNPFASLALIILAPLAASIVQLAISRTREYAADEAAAKATAQPRSLANALLKIDAIGKQVPMQINPAFSSLYIANPLSLQGIQSLFSTHPPIAERVARLEGLA